MTQGLQTLDNLSVSSIRCRPAGRPVGFPEVLARASRRAAARTSAHMPKRKRESLRRVPWDEGAMSPVQRLVASAWAESYGEHHAALSATNDTDLANSVVPRACPACGAGDPRPRGSTPRGVRMYGCRRCGRRFNALSGTVLDSRRMPAAEIVDVLLGLLSFQSVSATARATRHKADTVRYVLERAFAAVDGAQGGTVLSGVVWADETFWPVRARDKVRLPDGKQPRGHVNHDCVCVATDGRAHVYVHAGRGDQSGDSLCAALLPHVERGSELVHDANSAYNVVAREGGLVDRRVFSAKAHGGTEADNALLPVDRECGRVQAWLGSHPGVDRARLQDWLNLLWVVANVGDSPLHKVEYIIERSLRTPKARTYDEIFHIS